MNRTDSIGAKKKHDIFIVRSTCETSLSLRRLGLCVPIKSRWREDRLVETEGYESPAITTPDYSEHNIIYAINLYVWRDPDISTGSRPYCPWVITKAVAQSFFGGRESFIKNYTVPFILHIYEQQNILLLIL